MAYKADPITMQVIRYAMEQVADEMGRTLVRTGRSTIIKEIEDITCAVFDKYGNTVGQDAVGFKRFDDVQGDVLGSY